MSINKNVIILAPINAATADLGPINAKFYSDDIDSAQITINVLNNNQPVNLEENNFDVKLSLFNSNGLAFLEEQVDIIDSENGIILYKLSNSVLNSPGTYTAKLILVDNDSDIDKQIHVANFDFKVVNSFNQVTYTAVVGVETIETTLKELLKSQPELVNLDLANYYNKTEVDELINNLNASGNVDLSNYALKSELPVIPDLSNLATKDELPVIPDLSNLVTKDELPVIPDLSNLATKDELNNYSTLNELNNITTALNEYALKSELPIIPDLSSYATKEELPDISNLVTKEELPIIPDLSNLATKDELTSLTSKDELVNYALKSDIPNVTNLATKDELVNLATKDELPVVPDLSNLATKDELVNYALKSELPVVPDISNLATKDELVNYALKSELPDVSNLATKDELANTDNIINSLFFNSYSSEIYQLSLTLTQSNDFKMHLAETIRQSPELEQAIKEVMSR